MNKEKIIESVDNIISNLQKQKKLINHIQDILNCQPYKEDGYIVKLTKTRRKINGKHKP